MLSKEKLDSGELGFLRKCWGPGCLGRLSAPFGFPAQPASSRAHLRAPLFPAQRKRDLEPGLGWSQLYSGGVGVA